MVLDVHDYQIRLEGIIRLIKNEKRISDHNKELILKYQRDLITQGLGISRLTRKLYDLRTICTKWLPQDKNLEDVVIEDIKDIVMQVETSKYAEYSKRDFKINHRLPYQSTWIYYTQNLLKSHRKRATGGLY